MEPFTVVPEDVQCSICLTGIRPIVFIKKPLWVCQNCFGSRVEPIPFCELGIAK